MGMETFIIKIGNYAYLSMLFTPLVATFKY